MRAEKLGVTYASTSSGTPCMFATLIDDLTAKSVLVVANRKTGSILKGATSNLSPRMAGGYFKFESNMSKKESLFPIVLMTLVFVLYFEGIIGMVFPKFHGAAPISVKSRFFAYERFSISFL